MQDRNKKERISSSLSLGRYAVKTFFYDVGARARNKLKKTQETYTLEDLTDENFLRHENQLLEIENKSFPKNEGWDSAEFEDFHDPEWCFIIKTQSGVVAGYLFAEQENGRLEVNNLAIHPRYRRQGLAKQLIHNLITKAKKTPEIKELAYEVATQNAKAIALYDKIFSQFIDSGVTCDEKTLEDYYEPGNDCLRRVIRVDEEHTPKPSQP